MAAALAFCDAGCAGAAVVVACMKCALDAASGSCGAAVAPERRPPDFRFWLEEAELSASMRVLRRPRPLWLDTTCESSAAAVAWLSRGVFVSVDRRRLPPPRRCCCWFALGVFCGAYLCSPASLVDRGVSCCGVVESLVGLERRLRDRTCELLPALMLLS